MQGSLHYCCLQQEDLIHGCARGGRRIVEDVCYDIRRAEACVERARRRVEEHMALHSDVVNKTDLIIAYIPCMDIYSLWWIEQHLKDYKKRYNNDYKPKKAYVRFVQTAAKKAQVPVVEHV